MISFFLFFYFFLLSGKCDEGESTGRSERSFSILLYLSFVFFVFFQNNFPAVVPPPPSEWVNFRV